MITRLVTLEQSKYGYTTFYVRVLQTPILLTLHVMQELWTCYSLMYVSTTMPIWMPHAEFFAWLYGFWWKHVDICNSDKCKYEQTIGIA